MKLEQLLNELIERGWKPRGLKHKIFSVQRTPDNMIYFDGGFGLERCYDFRQLTSKESGLWQFCCENRFLKGPDSTDERQKNPIGASFDELFYASQYQFYLIECALKDESELEQFLIENIKIQ